MTVHRPPRLATWILERLGSTIIEDALVGDLFEAYQTRRSAFWYWGQVGAAIGVGACRDVWHHLPVALGAIVTGLFVAAVPVWLLINTSAASLSNVPLRVWIQTLAAWLVVFGSALLSGCLVRLLFRAHRRCCLSPRRLWSSARSFSPKRISALSRSAACSCSMSSQPLAADH